MKITYEISVPAGLTTQEDVLRWLQRRAKSNLEVNLVENRTKAIVTVYEAGAFTPPWED